MFNKNSDFSLLCKSEKSHHLLVCLQLLILIDLTLIGLVLISLPARRVASQWNCRENLHPFDLWCRNLWPKNLLLRPIFQGLLISLRFDMQVAESRRWKLTSPRSQHLIVLTDFLVKEGKTPKYPAYPSFLFGPCQRAEQTVSKFRKQPRAKIQVAISLCEESCYSK